MPIVFEMYLQKYFSPHLRGWEIKYASISCSDLSKYACKKTQGIEHLLRSSPEGSALLVVGGEVLCARNSGLFMHMHECSFRFSLLKIVSRLMRSKFSIISDRYYGTKWEFPYIPDKIEFSKPVDVYFNTVGGGLSHLTSANKSIVKNRIKSAKYISVRDTRTQKNLKNNGIESTVSPDSVFILPDIIEDSFLYNNVREEIVNKCNNEYFVFQAAPSKIRENITQICNNLERLSRETGKKIILLPIGYASGHDDNELLKRVQEKIHIECERLDDLNVWEILYVIKSSVGFLGTSLHGVITAMAYGVPHFGINNKIYKLDSFLNDWSVAPINRCFELSEAVDLIINDSVDISILKNNALSIIDKVKCNNEKIARLILGL
jgi:hypothetical protein